VALPRKADGALELWNPGTLELWNLYSLDRELL
jgi:hypothetical protein